MSCKIREWLKLLGLFDRTTHEDRLDIDREIEIRKGMHCDDAVKQGLVSERELREIVSSILQRRKIEAQIIV